MHIAVDDGLRILIVHLQRTHLKGPYLIAPRHQFHWNDLRSLGYRTILVPLEVETRLTAPNQGRVALYPRESFLQVAFAIKGTVDSGEHLNNVLRLRF